MKVTSERPAAVLPGATDGPCGGPSEPLEEQNLSPDVGAGPRGGPARLTDAFGRAFHYLRLSVDDSCNFRCVYCLPQGFQRTQADPPLSVDEVRRLARAFAGLGFWKVRLTGGEPTARRDLLELASAVAATPGIRRVALSTNGYRLVELAGGLKDAGVRAVNVSVDSLEPRRFAEITGHDRLPVVLAGVDAALSAGLETKVNVVMLKGLNDAEFGRFLDWAREAPVSVRFIELMRTGDNAELFHKRHLSSEGLIGLLRELGWAELARSDGDGPARVFRRPGCAGSVGVIAPYADSFCSTCNRLRVTSRGGLRLCLFAESDHSLRPLLQRDDQLAELQESVRSQLARKEPTHYLPEGRVGSAKHFALMGG